MTINELREKRNQAWNAAKAFVETKRDKDGLLSDEDSATYAQMEKKVQDYGAEIERMEAMAAMEAQLSKPTSAPITEKPLNGKTTEDKQPKSFRATDAYRSGMLNALRTNFRQISNVLQEVIYANGGYMVPDEYDSRLIQDDGIPYVCFRLEGETERYALVPPDGSCVYAAELDPDTDRYCITGVF